MCDFSFVGIGEGTKRTEETASKEGEMDVIIFDYIFINDFLLNIEFYIAFKRLVKDLV